MRTLMLGLSVVAGLAVVGVAQEPPAPSTTARQGEVQAFEVATVKRNTSAPGNSLLRRLPGGRVSATNMPVRALIQFAYSLAGYQIVGGPGWMSGEAYDIVAKMDGNPAPVAPGAGTDPAQLALRALLEDRFKLKFHRENRELGIYALVMAKPGGLPGPNLKPTTEDCAAAAAAAQRGALAPPPGSNAPFCGIQGGPGRIRFGGLPAAALPQAFANYADRMVVDRTGLTGSWDFVLTFAVESRSGLGGPDVPGGDQNAPSLFTAVQEQLGLKLEPTKGPVEVLVIDAIEKPVDD
jgi:uncharacterized protein (TIGR03435 family)